MLMNSIVAAVLLLALGQAAQGADAHSNAVNVLLQYYESSGATAFNGDRGETLWKSENPQNDGSVRSCQTCHGTDLKSAGKHARTKKSIKPMAMSVMPSRYQDVKKIKKWLKRNCKWTLGRECSAQEKGDILTYLLSQ